VRIDYFIDIGTELRGIYAGSFLSSIRDDCARHEATSLDGSQLSDGCAITAHDDSSSGFHLTEHCGGLIAKLALSDGTDFHESQCSTV
jgi:hypothetical protein